MNFVEVTDRWDTTQLIISDNPAHPDNGKTLGEVLPNICKVRVWRAEHGGYSWVIVYEPGLPSWSDEDKAQIGYNASYRKLGQVGSSNTIRIDGARWETFAEAERACRNVWRAIRRAA